MIMVLGSAAFMVKQSDKAAGARKPNPFGGRGKPVNQDELARPYLRPVCDHRRVVICPAILLVEKGDDYTASASGPEPT
jgi:hypothetical protein